MALIKCPDCGKEYSDRADSCPNCACPNDYKMQLEAQELQQEVNAVVKSSLEKEIFLRIFVLIASITLFIIGRDFIISDRWINDLGENIVVYSMILFLLVNFVVGIQMEGIKGGISGAIGGVILIVIITIVIEFVFKSNEFVQANNNWIASAVFGGYGLFYLLSIIPEFIKYNICKKDANINDHI